MAFCPSWPVHGIPSNGRPSSNPTCFPAPIKPDDPSSPRSLLPFDSSALSLPLFLAYPISLPSYETSHLSAPYKSNPYCLHKRPIRADHSIVNRL